jgi:hypothetical protein
MFGVPKDAVTREPTIEELNARIPRKVFLYSNDSQSLLTMIVFFVGGGLIWFTTLAYLTTQQVQHRNALARQGQVTNATVTRILSGHSTSAVYTFQTAGAAYRGEAKIPEGQHLVPRVGEQLPVLFLPFDPSVNHPRDWVWWTGWDVVPHVFVLFFTGLGFTLVGIMYRERRLARFGWVTEGTVTLCVPNKKRFTVDYEFRTDKNELLEGSTSDCEDEYKAGSKIQVIYLRHHPKRNSAYPMDLYHVQDFK